MNRAVKKKHNLYSYLDDTKVLESGTEQDIAEARKMYWRIYKAAWRRQRRKEEKELTTSWTTDEFKILTAVAQKHNQSRTRFIKNSTLAYIDKRYIVPDSIEVRRIAQILAMTYNSIQEMINENALHLQTGKIILEKIFDLERLVLVSLYNPKTLEQLIAEAVNKNPQTKATLCRLLETIPEYGTQKP